MFEILQRPMQLNNNDKGGFTPIGLTLLQNLAQRGAHIIALSADPIGSPDVTILITLLRSTTSNEKNFAE